MTKPVTAVLAMQLWEEGAFELNDPVYRYIPAFRNQKVWRSGSSRAPVLDPIVEKMRLWHLFSQPGSRMGSCSPNRRRAVPQGRFEWGMPRDLDLEAVVDRWASLPCCSPGTEWNYPLTSTCSPFWK
jgi:CubicO group peptidase (beta-lactamase class C family)